MLKKMILLLKYEQFKMHIKDVQNRAKEKYSFLNPFSQSKPLRDYLINYTKDKMSK